MKNINVLCYIIIFVCGVIRVTYSVTYILASCFSFIFASDIFVLTSLTTAIAKF
jgi:hypothetical protein